MAMSGLPLYHDTSCMMISSDPSRSGGFPLFISSLVRPPIFDAIHSEAEANIARLNESQSTHLLKIGGGPDTHLGDLAREDAFL